MFIQMKPSLQSRGVLFSGGDSWKSGLRTLATRAMEVFESEFNPKTKNNTQPMQVMNMNTRIRRNWLVVAFLSLIIQARALDVIDPTGVNYTVISDSSHFDASYTAANLFDLNMTGVPVGTGLAGNDFAKSGTGESYVAFQLDQNYTNIGSIFYAQRGANSTTVDKVWTISIWASSSTPFTAADPGVPANSVVEVNHTPGAAWTEYALTNTIVGQYFLLKLEQTVLAGNPGGREFRLGALLGQAPVMVQAPSDKTVYVGGKARFSAQTAGTAPLTYQWAKGATLLTNDARISGATTANLVISPAILSDAGAYSLTVTNAYGTNSGTTFNLNVVPAPVNPVATTIISNGPVAYWQFNETVGSTVALDLVGSYNGVYGSLSGVGATGPRPPTYPGFVSTNTGVQTIAFTSDSAVKMPPLNLSTSNSVTIVAWIYSDVSGGPQNPYTAIAYCRGGSTSAGLILSSDGTKVAYQWAGTRYFFDSGITVPVNQWTMVAMVYTTNATTLYCGTTNGLVLAATDNFTQAGQAFDFTTYIGLDTDLGGSARTFNGVIDDVAFFNRALSKAEIGAIYSAGTGIVPSLQILSQTTNQSLFLGDRLSLAAVVSGPNPVYQWYKQDAPIAGATNDTYIVNSAKVSDGGNYYLVATNQANSVTSAVINVTVTSYLVWPLSPPGTLYTGIIASSEYPDPDYKGTNLFDSDLTGLSVGAQLNGGDWADDGVALALGPAYLSFQVDQAYPVNAIFYAQRKNISGNPIDKVTALSLWASSSTPFAAADPGTTPDGVVPVPDIDGGVLHRYILPSTVTGKYFVIKAEQNPTVANSNIGGNEFRLGVFVTPAALTFTPSPGALTLNWTYGTLQSADNVTGPWTAATGITSGVPFSTTNAKSFYRVLY